MIKRVLRPISQNEPNLASKVNKEDTKPIAYITTMPPDEWVPNPSTMNKGHRTDCNPIARYAYLHSVRMHPAQEKLVERTEQEPRGSMLGAPDEMQLFQNLLKLLKAKRCLDIGVFTGFSSLSMALALPDDGQVVALDISDVFLQRCNSYEIFEEAGVANKIDFRCGEAVDSLRKILDSDGEDSFDFAFIDADKAHLDDYYELSLKLVRQGGIVAIDNTLWGGSVIDPNNHSAETAAVRALNDKIAKDDRVSASFLTIADGVTLCFKK